MKDHPIVPPQEEGGKTAAQAEASFGDVQEAKAAFQRARNRLLDISRWREYAGNTGAHFLLTDPGGVAREGPASLGDYIRIDLPAPGPRAGGGYDWVRIEAIESESVPEKDRELFAIRVRPSAAPQSADETVAHFYTEEASSTFLIQRTAAHISAAEKGRNEVLNNKDGSMADQLRNSLIGFSARLGLAVPQWELLLQGLLR